MFGIGMTELIVVLVLATIVLGPEKMIEFAGQLGRWLAKFRAETNEVTREFREAFDVELGDFRQDINEVKHELAEIRNAGDTLASQLDPSQPRPRSRPVANLPTQARASSRPAFNLPTGSRAASPAAAPVISGPAHTMSAAAATMVAIQHTPQDETPAREIVRDLDPDADAIEISLGELMGEDVDAEAFDLEGPVLMEEPTPYEQPKEPANGQSGDAAAGEVLEEE